MENNENIENKLLLEIEELKEKYNKRLMLAMWSIMAISLVSFLFVIILASVLLPEGPVQLAVILVSFVLLLISCFIALKFEVDAGYYKCKGCGHKFVPTYKNVLFSMHKGTTRRLKCPECEKKTWCKKVLK